MKLETFRVIIDTLKEQTELTTELYKLNIDLIDYSDPYQRVIETLIEELYGEDGFELYGWFCYENEYGKGMSKENPKAWDKDRNPICYDVESLWRELESINK